MSPTPIDNSVWGTDSGLLDDFTLIFGDTWFGVNPESDYPDVNYMHVRGPASVNDELVDDAYAVRFGTGKNWEVIAGGDSVEHASGNLKFHGRSAMGQFVTRILELMNQDEALTEAIVSRGAPTEAATWNGLAFDMELVEDSFTDKAGEKHEFFRQLPTKFRPDLMEGASGKKSSGKAEGLSKKDLRKAVIKFAAGFESDEFGDFVEDVFDEEEFEFAGDIGEALRASIIDADEIFAEAQN